MQTPMHEDHPNHFGLRRRPFRQVFVQTLPNIRPANPTKERHLSLEPHGWEDQQVTGPKFYLNLPSINRTHGEHRGHHTNDRTVKLQQPEPHIPIDLSHLASPPVKNEILRKLLQTDLHLWRGEEKTLTLHWGKKAKVLHLGGSNAGQCLVEKSIRQLRHCPSGR